VSYEVVLPPPDLDGIVINLKLSQIQRQRCGDEVLNRKPKVILIAGPTASGKTALSLYLAQHLGIEIISADSVQVYRGMDIGTAKVSPQERQIVPHYLIDTQPIKEQFNVADFHRGATEAIKHICARGKVPVIVGGTGFYFHSLLYGMPDSPPTNLALRKTLEQEMDILGLEVMYDNLAAKDPNYAQTISRRDRQKIIRGLEIIELTGRKVSDNEWKERSPSTQYDFRCWFVTRPREILYKRVEQRCDQMIQDGLINEVMTLEDYGLRDNNSAAQAIGYRQVLDYLATDQTATDYTKFIEDLKTASRHYVKRQLTWFKREPLFRWLDIEELGMEQVAQIILEDYNN
jgi:tRNA dimethylallyltransferase